MIKIYGNGCRQCKQIEMWIDKGLTTVECEYKHLETGEELDDIMKVYDTVQSMPFGVRGENIMTFDEIMDEFGDNRS